MSSFHPGQKGSGNTPRKPRIRPSTHRTRTPVDSTSNIGSTPRSDSNTQGSNSDSSQKQKHFKVEREADTSSEDSKSTKLEKKDLRKSKETEKETEKETKGRKKSKERNSTDAPKTTNNSASSNASSASSSATNLEQQDSSSNRSNILNASTARSQKPAPSKEISSDLLQLKNSQSEIINLAKSIIKQVKTETALDIGDIDQILADCKEKPDGAFGSIAKKLDLTALLKIKRPARKGGDKNKTSLDGSIYYEVIDTLNQVFFEAQAFINNNKKSVKYKKQCEYCNLFINNIGKYINLIQTKNKYLQDLCNECTNELQNEKIVSPKVADELQLLLTEALLSDETKFQIRDTIPKIFEAAQKEGYKKFAQALGTITEEQTLELLEAYGCYTKPVGGTSDVKLLRAQSGEILCVLKATDAESSQALKYLKLGSGACGLREDVASTVCQKFKSLTDVNLGAPIAKLMTVNEKHYAVIDAVQGNVVDGDDIDNLQKQVKQFENLKQRLSDRKRPQPEIDQIDKQLANLQGKLKSAQTNFDEIPKHVTEESMTKVILAFMITAQWDVKWGNIITNAGTARPIDMGASLPTLGTLDSYFSGFTRDALSIPDFRSLINYPVYPFDDKDKTDEQKKSMVGYLPLATQPMDRGVIKAILEHKGGLADELVKAAMNRRNELDNDNFEEEQSSIDDNDENQSSTDDYQLDDNDLNSGTPLMKNASLLIMRDSIKAVIDILDKDTTQAITFEKFIGAWENWFRTWGKDFLTEADKSQKL